VRRVSVREKAVADKALCYVVRDGRLLVFRHVDYSYEEAGIQVRGGGIRQGTGQGALGGRLYD
jgi:hypothetical protein